MVNPKKTNCYICGSKEFSQRPGEVRDNNALAVLVCKKCGLVFLSSVDHINRSFYENSGMHTGEAELPQPDVWLKEGEWDDERRFKYLASFLKNKTLLDFGCGAGGFLSKAKTLCSKAFGIEPEVRLQQHFKKMGLKVYEDVKVFQKMSEKGFKADILTVFHVLEHLPDPRQTLKELGSILAKNGRIIVEIPHADDALLTMYKSEPFSRFTYWSCHLFLFNNSSLGKLAQQAGLKVDYIKQIQRYPLSNHLYWLSNDKPGGHQVWSFLDSDELHAAYEKQLASIGGCDTLLASFSKD